ncbi:endoribonuclease YBEY, chloroplastic-like isoform X2 [Zingiber officinale]|uniref:endoribonuclease YBEY, chloroplastic-like isoform X2 n=1 Tax=Zingiber officinale TaxID=94328 RepID=UPI001C4D6754|nr:endoribonuclease YBEY, chloroplastic-like isoform X2 [Zingiber officinale]
MASLVARALPVASGRATPRLSLVGAVALSRRPIPYPGGPLLIVSPHPTSVFLRPFSNPCDIWLGSLSRSFRSLSPLPPCSIYSVSARGFRKVRRGKLNKKKEKKPLELDVTICIEEGLPDDPQTLRIAEKLQSDVPIVLKVAFDNLKASDYKTRDTSIGDIYKYDKVELSVLLCDDNFIQKLNKEWRDVDQATDVLSMSQHIPELDLPILSLGDVVISLETATKQAKERSHTLIDEIRVLMVHGLLHLLGFDHELGLQAEAEMEKEEDFILRNLGWKGKGLIKCAHDSGIQGSCPTNSSDGHAKNMKTESQSGFCEAKLSYIFCDVDGEMTHQVDTLMTKALEVALSEGVNIAVITRKTRSAVIRVSRTINLKGKACIISETSAGVFLQGSLVYGRQGKEIFRANLDKNLCREPTYPLQQIMKTPIYGTMPNELIRAFQYSLQHGLPLVAFCQDQCLTLFDHPLVDSQHTLHHEPKVVVIPSIERLLASSDLQKLVFLGTAEEISALRPYWTEATRGLADVVPSQTCMLEIIPSGVSKDSGVKMLLDHLGIATDEILPHFDNENKMTMMQNASASSSNMVMPDES